MLFRSILEVLVSRNSISPETEELRLELDKLRLERMDRMEKEKKHKKVNRLTDATLRQQSVMFSYSTEITVDVGSK